jgi:hypothetical protein
MQKKSSHENAEVVTPGEGGKMEQGMYGRVCIYILLNYFTSI